MMTTGERIRYFRKQRKLTQVQLAEMTGIHPVSIRKYEINLMQPQIEQIERIASALKVNVSAITGLSSTVIRFDTVGDMMGLLISWHKSGILTIQGKRDEDHKIQMETAHLVPNPVLERYLALKWTDGKKEKAVDWNSFHLDICGYAMLRDLLNWEQYYYIYTQSARFMTENADEETKKNYTELENTLEMIELELQASQAKLSFSDDE